MCRIKFLPGNIFFLSEEHLVTYLFVRDLMVRHSWLLLFWKYLYFYFQKYLLHDVTSLSPVLHSFWQEVYWNLYLCSSECNVSFFLGLPFKLSLYVSLSAVWIWCVKMLSVCLYLCLFPYLAVPGLSCGMWNLGSSL